jgi:hypothetical protein
MVTATAVYLLSLLPILHIGEWIGTAVLCAAIAILTSKLKLKSMGSIACIVAGYLLQDLAHLGTGEETFQSSYSDGGQVSIS